MILEGSFSDITTKITKLLKQIETVDRSSLSIKFTFMHNEQEMVLFYKNNPETLIESYEQLEGLAESDNPIYMIDKDIYYLLTSASSNHKNSNIPELASRSNSSEPNTSIQNPKTKKPKTKTGISFTRSSSAKSVEIQKESSATTTSPESLSNQFVIESYVSDAERAERPCALGIKQIDSNIFVAYYRSTIFDKGADTTFRHYLAYQPGTLVSYTYFHKKANLKDLFKSVGTSLKRNGKNNLSLIQTEQILMQLHTLVFL